MLDTRKYFRGSFETQRYVKLWVISERGLHIWKADTVWRKYDQVQLQSCFNRMSTEFGNCVARRISVYYTPQTPKLCKLMSANSKEEKFCLKSSTVNLRIQCEYRKIRTRENSVFGHFSRSSGKQERVQTDFNRNT